LRYAFIENAPAMIAPADVALAAHHLSRYVRRRASKRELFATGSGNGLFGDAPHPYGAALKGVWRRCTPPFERALAESPRGQLESRL
jgi:hypothetical protein